MTAGLPALCRFWSGPACSQQRSTARRAAASRQLGDPAQAARYVNTMASPGKQARMLIWRLCMLVLSLTASPEESPHLGTASKWLVLRCTRLVVLFLWCICRRK